MGEFKIVSFSLWIFTATILSIFFVIAFMVFSTNKNKLFKYFALYCLYTLLYVLYAYDFGNNIFYTTMYSVNSGFNIAIQLVYHAYYMLFALLFLQMSKFKPNLNNFLQKYAYTVLIVGCLLFVAGFIPGIPRLVYRNFFSFVFLPIHLSLALGIMFVIFKVKSKGKYYFIIGSLLYMIFAMYAYFLSFFSNWKGHPLLEPIDYFYIAIVLVCFIFGYGLAKYIKELYYEKQKAQMELAEAQLQIQERLEERIVDQEKENQILLEEKHKQELISEVLNLQQKVLRSQINSHFIFNVLNSIKLFILENDVPKASLYLGKFARFIRNVLDNSISEQNNLADELETLELYVSIEKMRFNDKFIYEFDIQENINLVNYPFPPLLLQPFVENALWHGLMQKEKNALMIIRIYESKNELIIEIDDNGIGYKKSISMKKEGHKSLGLNIVKERIEHYNKQQKFNLEYKIFDKSEFSEENGTIARLILSNN